MSSPGKSNPSRGRHSDQTFVAIMLLWRKYKSSLEPRRDARQPLGALWRSIQQEEINILLLFGRRECAPQGLDWRLYKTAAARSSEAVANISAQEAINIRLRGPTTNCAAPKSAILLWLNKPVRLSSPVGPG